MQYSDSKQYDAHYFRRWYRDAGLADPARLRRKVALAVAQAEYYLERPIRSVLDVGCGEAAWRAPLLALRPKLSYLGFDSSAYAVQRYGRSRQIHPARFGDFAWLRPCAPVDLLICSDVLHYVPTREFNQGLPGLAEMCAGVAFLEAFAEEDAFEGDHDGFPGATGALVSQALRQRGFCCAGVALLVIAAVGRSHVCVGTWLTGVWTAQ